MYRWSTIGSGHRSRPLSQNWPKQFLETLTSESGQSWRLRKRPMPKISMGRAVSLWAEKGRAQPALTADGITRTRGDLDRRTNQIGHWLIGLGLAKYDLVITTLPNSIELVECLLACLKIGARFLPLSAKMPP